MHFVDAQHASVCVHVQLQLTGPDVQLKIVLSSFFPNLNILSELPPHNCFRYKNDWVSQHRIHLPDWESPEKARQAEQTTINISFFASDRLTQPVLAPDLRQFSNMC